MKKQVSKTSGRSGWKIFKIVLLCLAFLGVGAAGLFYYYLNQPFSSEMIQKRVVSRLERISGMRVEYDDATLDLHNEMYRIKNLRFYEHNKTETPLFSLEDLAAKVRVLSIRSGEEAFIERVVITNPSRLDVVFDGRSYHPSRKLKFLIDTVSHAQSKDAKEPATTLPFENLKIEKLQLGILTSSVLLPNLENPEPNSIVQGNIDLKNGENKTLDLSFTGGIIASSDKESTQVASGLDAHITVSPEEEKVLLKSEIDLALLQEVMPNVLPGKIEGHDAKLNLELAKRDGRFLGKFDGQLGDIDWMPTGNEVAFSDTNLSVDGTGSYDPENLLFQIDSNLKSDQFSGHFSGSSTVSDDKPFSVKMVFGKLGEKYRQLFSRALPDGIVVHGEDDSLSGTLAMSGDRHSFSDIAGILDMKNIEIRLPGISKALHFNKGKVVLTNDDIQLSESSLKVGGTSIKVSGGLTGNYLRKEKSNVNLNWGVSTTLDDLLWIYDQSGKAPEGLDVSGKGRIEGSGTYKQTINLSDSTQNSTPIVRGKIDIKNATIKHSSLPAPVTGINAEVSVNENQIKLENAKADIQGADVSLNGIVKGSGNEGYFWQDPQASGSVVLKADISQFNQFLTAEQKAKLSHYEVAGKLRSSLILNGKLKDLKDSAVFGDIYISQGKFNPKLETLAGSFTGVETVLRITQSAIEVKNFSGFVGGQKISGTASINEHSVAMNVSGGGDTGKLVSLFPKLSKWVVTSGQLNYGVKFSAGEAGETNRELKISEILESGLRLLNKAIVDKTYNISGTLDFSGLNLRHIAMPPARKEKGNSIPEGNLNGVKGTVLIKNDRFEVPASNPLVGNLSNTKNCRISGSIEVRKDNLPKISLKIVTPSELKLDPWVMGWGKGVDTPSSPPNDGKKFQMDVDVSGGAITFRGQNAGRVRGLVSYRMEHNNSPRVTTFNEIVIQGKNPGEGRIIGGGRIDSYVWEKNAYPKWQTNVDVQQMPLETMLASVFLDPANIRGTVVSGKLHVNGVNDNPLSISGGGNLAMTNVELGGSNVIRQLGNTTGRNFGGTLFETAQAATFNIGNGALSSRDLAFQSNGLQMAMKGDYYFSADTRRGIPAKTVNGMVQLKLFKSVFGSLPIIGNLADLADDVTNAFLLAFRVEGTADSPQVTPVAIPMFQGY